MSTSEEQLRQLRLLNASILESDRILREEHEDLSGRAAAAEATEAAGDPVARGIAQESIALRRLRPVLAIRDNEARLVFENTEDSEVWKARLTKAKAALDRAIRAVGRIDLAAAPLDWVGTGWLVAETILVTNRHVAREFARRDGKGFVFRMGEGERITASVDFLQEIENPRRLVFDLVRPLHIEEAEGPDIALFEVAVTAGDPTLAAPIALAKTVAATENAATIGYPAYDSRIPEPALMERIYGKTYNKKRLAPGGVTRVEATRLLHNCTTLGGNSGSVVVDLESGDALGLHFSGRFLATNYAVRADIVAKVLDDVRAGRAGRREVRADPPPAPGRPAAPATVPSAAAAPAPQLGAASITIPLTLTVSIGTPGQAVVQAARTAPPAPIPAADAAGEEVEGEEARAADYTDREGYAPGFLGPDFAVALPTVLRDADDVLDFDLDGRAQTELRYEHFSVVMSRSRRMCFLSAVNIDGNLSKKTKRTPWRWDPRIPRAQQIMNECYGNPPRFSRGHMSRREDPAWGPDAATAKRGNEDSMHVTNTTPQMQAFNAPIWLELEDYALGHAREDDMKISVFTGPYFSEGDPEMYGVRIPLAFWKIIAFIHDETGELCATGYEMNQEKSLQPEEEFVFGQFQSSHLHEAAQVAIRSIATRSGIDFGRLASADPLASLSESRAETGRLRRLESVEQIRFLA